jgi:hypothetical protein
MPGTDAESSVALSAALLVSSSAVFGAVVLLVDPPKSPPPIPLEPLPEPKLLLPNVNEPLLPKVKPEVLALPLSPVDVVSADEASPLLPLPPLAPTANPNPTGFPRLPPLGELLPPIPPPKVGIVFDGESGLVGVLGAGVPKSEVEVDVAASLVLLPNENGSEVVGASFDNEEPEEPNVKGEEPDLLLLSLELDAPEAASLVVDFPNPNENGDGLVLSPAEVFSVSSSFLVLPKEKGFDANPPDDVEPKVVNDAGAVSFTLLSDAVTEEPKVKELEDFVSPLATGLSVFSGPMADLNGAKVDEKEGVAEGLLCGSADVDTVLPAKVKPDGGVGIEKAGVLEGAALAGA